jgi:hypothetical protein
MLLIHIIHYSVIATKQYYDSILVRVIQQHNDDMPESTEVDSAVVSPLIKHSPDDGPCAAEKAQKGTVQWSPH